MCPGLLSLEALEMLRGLCREHGASLVCVSHDPRVLEAFDTSIDFQDVNAAMANEVTGGMNP